MAAVAVTAVPTGTPFCVRVTVTPGKPVSLAGSKPLAPLKSGSTNTVPPRLAATTRTVTLFEKVLNVAPGPLPVDGLPGWVRPVPGPPCAALTLLA